MSGKTISEVNEDIDESGYWFAVCQIISDAWIKCDETTTALYSDTVYESSKGRTFTSNDKAYKVANQTEVELLTHQNSMET
jgi:hypothetical protein